MSDPKRAILLRRARFVSAALAGIGCSPAAKPVDPGGAHDIVIPPLASSGFDTEAPVADVPARVDTDGDGIFDPDDACPDKVGPHSVDAARNGCPPVVVSVCLSIIMPPKVTFATNGTTPVSLSTLETIAGTMKANPQVNVEIEGHTDATENGALGLQRANTVKAELVKRGIAQTRITTSNAGATKPLTSNSTAVDRAKNRRVEFIVR